MIFLTMPKFEQTVNDFPVISNPTTSTMAMGDTSNTNVSMEERNIDMELLEQFKRAISNLYGSINGSCSMQQSANANANGNGDTIIISDDEAAGGSNRATRSIQAVTDNNQAPGSSVSLESNFDLTEKIYDPFEFIKFKNRVFIVSFCLV